jgi:hypothetical protein
LIYSGASISSNAATSYYGGTKGGEICLCSVSNSILMFVPTILSEGNTRFIMIYSDRFVAFDFLAMRIFRGFPRRALLQKCGIVIGSISIPEHINNMRFKYLFDQAY